MFIGIAHPLLLLLLNDNSVFFVTYINSNSHKTVTIVTVYAFFTL
jgi:hypothetical protein